MKKKFLVLIVVLILIMAGSMVTVQLLNQKINADVVTKNSIEHSKIIVPSSLLTSQKDLVSSAKTKKNKADKFEKYISDKTKELSANSKGHGLLIDVVDTYGKSLTDSSIPEYANKIPPKSLVSGPFAFSAEIKNPSIIDAFNKGYADLKIRLGAPLDSNTIRVAYGDTDYTSYYPALHKIILSKLFFSGSSALEDEYRFAINHELVHAFFGRFATAMPIQWSEAFAQVLAQKMTPEADVYGGSDTEPYNDSHIDYRSDYAMYMYFPAVLDKIYMEDPNFIKKIKDQMASSSQFFSLLSRFKYTPYFNTDKIKRIIASNVSTIENTPTVSWLDSWYIITRYDKVPPLVWGTAASSFFIDVNEKDVSIYHCDPTSKILTNEINVKNASTYDITMEGATGNILWQLRGIKTPTIPIIISASDSFLNYKGTVTIYVTAKTNRGTTVTEKDQMIIGGFLGQEHLSEISGIVLGGADSVIIRSPNGKQGQYKISNGAFWANDLTFKEQGKYTLEFYNGSQKLLSKQINKPINGYIANVPNVNNFITTP